MKILAQRPTRISAVATILLITKTFTVKYYYRRIYTNTATAKIKIKINKIIIITTTTHIKPDSDCNRNEDNSSEKQLERKSLKLS